MKSESRNLQGFTDSVQYHRPKTVERKLWFSRLFRRQQTVPLSARAIRDEWLQWMLLGRLSPRTVNGYRLTTERLLKRYPELGFDEFTDEHIQGIIEESRPASRQTARAPFTNWFAWRYKTRLIPRNPMHHVDTYKQPAPPRPDVFSDVERKILCALPEPNGTLIALLLKNDWINGDHGHIGELEALDAAE